MARFYHCGDCGSEFLGPDDIPDHEPNVEPICWRCYPYVVCDMCGDTFRSDANSTGYCPSCYTRKVLPVEEEMARIGGM